MPSVAFSHHVFVDFENVGSVDLAPIEGKPVHVTLLIGKNQHKLELPLVTQIHRLSGQVELIEVGASGRNALDLTLAAYLGRAVERQPGATFAIVSKDKDFDAMIRHFRSAGVVVGRHESLASAASVPGRKRAAQKPAPKTDTRREKILGHLADPHARNRPRSRKSLIAHIRAQLGKESTDHAVQSVLDTLVDSGVLSIDSKDKVGYRT